jgi:hypothetical protein
MDLVGTLVSQLLTNAGDLWGGALIGQFFVMICESAKPKPAAREADAEPRGFDLLVLILSLFTPLLLLVHAFYVGAGAPIAILALVGGVIIAAGLMGWIIGLAAPPIGRTLNRAAPILAVAVFALAIYVTWRSAIGFLNIFVAGSAA